MAKKLYEESNIQAIAVAIRENAPIEDKFTTAEMAGGVSSACSYQNEAGYSKGRDEGFEEGVSVGREIGFDEGKTEGITEGIQTEQAVTDAFLSDKNIGDYVNDRVTELAAYAFGFKTSMLSAKLGNVTKINGYAFANASGAKVIELPSLTTILSASQFSGCKALERLDLGVVNNIPNACFSNATVLDTIILRKTSITTLANVGAFNGTPYASGGSGGKIYVPSALIEQYKTATNWSVVFGYGTVEFVSLEGSEYA